MPIWLRLAGALAGGSLAALAATISYWFGLYWWEMGIGPIAQLGVGVGTMVGFAAGPTAVTTPRPILFGLGVAVKAVFIGLALYLAGAMTIAVASGGAIDAGAIAFVLFAVPSALALALPVTIPIALVAMAVARVTRRHRRRGLLALATIVLSTAGLTVAASQGPPPHRDRDPGLGVEFAQVRLEWTVVNRSDDDLLLSVWAWTDAGAGGSSRGLPACFTVTGRSWEETDWFIGFENDRNSTEGAIPDAVVSASDIPGSEPRVWIDVAPGGELTVIPGRAAPPADQLVVDHCLEPSE